MFLFSQNLAVLRKLSFRFRHSCAVIYKFGYFVKKMINNKFSYYNKLLQSP